MKKLFLLAFTVFMTLMYKIFDRSTKYERTEHEVELHDNLNIDDHNDFF